MAAWLKARNMTGDDGYAYFVKKAADMVIALGKRPVQWVEVRVGQGVVAVGGSVTLSFRSSVGDVKIRARLGLTIRVGGHAGSTPP